VRRTLTGGRANPDPARDLAAMEEALGGVGTIAFRWAFGEVWSRPELGRRERSIVLEADGRHLLTDVWTSAGVLAAVGLVALTGWNRLDPVIALAVALNIIITGTGLVRRSVGGLMDRGLDAADQARIADVLARFEGDGITFHALRTRQAGSRAFISLHVLVPGAWTVQRGHDLIEDIERDLSAAIPHATVFTHLEPREDPRSFADVELERKRTD